MRQSIPVNGFYPLISLLLLYQHCDSGISVVNPIYRGFRKTLRAPNVDVAI
jgi:hypothetical protein